MNEMTGRALAVVGLALTVVAIFLDVTKGSDDSYWSDGTQGAFLLVLAAIAGLLLALSWVQNRPHPARIALGVCFLLLGYYLWLPALAAFGNLDELRAGAWLGLAGAIVAVIGAWIGSQSLGSAPVKGSARSASGLQIGLVAALAGVVLCVISIWLDAADIGISYWDLSEDRMLGIVMLIVAIACGLTVLATWMNRAQASALWASLLGLMLFGLFAVFVVIQAFDGFGDLAVGAWLGFIGGIAAFVGAQAAHMSTAGEVRMASPAPAEPPPPPPTAP